MPAQTADTGRRGEDAAAAWLRSHGYELCARNWRNGRYELDIVARRFDTLHFVEVKTRRAGGLTPPEAAATPRKYQALCRAAEAYIACNGCDGYEIQFDLAAVDIFPDGTSEVRLIGQAMESHW